MAKKNLKGDALEALTAGQAATMSLLTSASGIPASSPAPVKAATGPSRETKSKRIQVLMRPSLYDALKARADAEGYSVNDLINIILKENI